MRNKSYYITSWQQAKINSYEKNNIWNNNSINRVLQ